MKYVLMIYTNAKNWEHPIYRRDPAFQALPEEVRDALVERQASMFDEMKASGELISGTALADPSTTRTVRVRDGAPATTDGPLGEAKEQLAGYFVIDCESPERALEIAASFPDAHVASVEVRPIMHASGQEM